MAIKKTVLAAIPVLGLESVYPSGSVIGPSGPAVSPGRTPTAGVIGPCSTPTAVIGPRPASTAAIGPGGRCFYLCVVTQQSATRQRTTDHDFRPFLKAVEKTPSVHQLLRAAGNLFVLVPCDIHIHF